MQEKKENVCKHDFSGRFGVTVEALRIWCRLNNVKFPKPHAKEKRTGGTMHRYLVSDIEAIMAKRKERGL